jgi:hypothetical protein
MPPARSHFFIDRVFLWHPRSTEYTVAVRVHRAEQLQNGKRGFRTSPMLTAGDCRNPDRAVPAGDGVPHWCYGHYRVGRGDRLRLF